jgi:hypothetical protein
MAANQWGGLWSGRQPVGDVHQRAREIVRRTGGIVRGKFPSRKNGRMVHHEGMLELDAIYLFETSQRIVRYREQPETIHYPDGKKLRRYTPDFELLLTSGELVLIEVKPIFYLKGSEVQHKLKAVAAHLSRTNQAFDILTEKNIRITPRLDNLRFIYHSASRVPHTHDYLSAALNRYRNEFPLAIDRAISLLAKHSITPYCLLVSGLVHCDLNVQIGLHTQLHICEGHENAWLFSAKEYGF